MKRYQHYIFDWGDTLMIDLPGQVGPMCDWPEVEIVHDAAQCLSALSKIAQCHIATNALNSNENEIRAAFTRAGLSPFIDTIFCADTIGKSKPEPEYFQFVISKLHVPKSDIVMIGDSIEKDIRGALRQGIDAIWFNPSQLTVPKGIKAISRLVELVTS
jgi:putative hydrolase of the HAD superfamily